MYPILLVHGVAVSHRRERAIWRHIKAALEARGAQVFLSGQDSFGSIENNAAQLAARIRQVCAQTGAPKVNIIAHSKGGLDARYCICHGAAAQVASLTTLCTPHNGIHAFDLLSQAPGIKALAALINLASRAGGDAQPDALTACRQGGKVAGERFNADNPAAPGVIYRHYSFVLKRLSDSPISAVAWAILKRTDGPNDGLVPLAATRYGGSDYQGELCREDGRGIAHGAMRYHPELVVQMAAQLKDLGL
jgi:triacylglycerol lipase